MKPRKLRRSAQNYRVTRKAQGQKNVYLFEGTWNLKRVSPSALSHQPPLPYVHMDHFPMDVGMPLSRFIWY